MQSALVATFVRIGAGVVGTFPLCFALFTAHECLASPRERGALVCASSTVRKPGWYMACRGRFPGRVGQKTTVRHERNVKTLEESSVSRDSKTALSLGSSALFSREGLRHGSSVSSIPLLSPSNTRSALPGLS
jgi:hypothetical protein